MITLYKRFVLGVDRAKMRLYDVEQSAQGDILDGQYLIIQILVKE